MSSSVARAQSSSVARAQSSSVARAQSTSLARAQSPSSDCLDSEGEGIVHCKSPKTFAITGTPTPTWKDDAMAFLATLVHEHEDVRPVECQEIAPHIRDSIRPDGNCLYRAISKQVTGSQHNHMALRLAMIQFMLHNEHAVAVARLMNVKFRGDVLDDHERKRRTVAALHFVSLPLCFNWRYSPSVEVVRVNVVGYIFCQYFQNPPVCPCMVTKYSCITTVLVTTIIG